MASGVLHLDVLWDAFVLLAWIALAAAMVLYAAFLLLRLFHRRYAGKSEAVPVASFFGAITTIWALVFGFVSADVWSANYNAGAAAVEERSSLIRLSGMAASEALALPELEDALRLYVAVVTEEEWEVLRNRAAAPEAEDALQAIRLALLAANDQGVSSALLSKMIADFDELQDARTKRLAIGASGIQPLKWTLVIVLGLMSMVSIAFVHCDKPRAGRTALSIFTLAVVSAIWLVLLHAAPYEGPMRIDGTAIVL